MDKQIPIYFNNVIIVDAPMQEISNTNSSAFRLKVGAFYKYKNRNYSYITDEYAELLIQSAVRGNVPVIGFFDPQSETWAGHTGPTLASAYGYIESFLGWEPLQDTDGETHDYAIFSVVLFTDYYEEAQKIKGQNQSMELKRDTITGDWIELDGEYYFVYKTGDMDGFCVIGSHEPCFSVSSFFSHSVPELKEQINKAEKGGEHFMDGENQVVETETQEQEEVTIDAATVEVQVEEPVVNEPETKVEETTNFEAMYNELQTEFAQLQESLTNAQARITELESVQTENENLRTKVEELQASVASYEAQAIEVENARKATLLDTYATRIADTDAFNIIKEGAAGFSYDELEGKLAILFSNEQLAKQENETLISIPEQPKSSFALLMEKYRKN